MHQPILRALREGPLTVPQIAERIGHPARETLLWVMGMRKYGWLAELPGVTADGYYRSGSMQDQKEKADIACKEAQA